MVYFADADIEAACRDLKIDHVKFMKQLESSKIAEPERGSIFTFGKHKGKKVEEVMQTDKGYITWFLAKDNEDFPQTEYIKNLLE